MPQASVHFGPMHGRWRLGHIEAVDHDVDFRLHNIEVTPFEHLFGGLTPSRSEQLSGIVG